MTITGIILRALAIGGLAACCVCYQLLLEQAHKRLTRKAQDLCDDQDKMIKGLIADCNTLLDMNDRQMTNYNSLHAELDAVIAQRDEAEARLFAKPTPVHEIK
jgi:hypothetical protein